MVGWRQQHQGHLHVPKDGGNNEARLPFSSRDKSLSSNLGESVTSELEMPKDDKTGSKFQGRKLSFTFNFLIRRNQVSLRMRKCSYKQSRRGQSLEVGEVLVGLKWPLVVPLQRSGERGGTSGLEKSRQANDYTELLLGYVRSKSNQT